MSPKVSKELSKHRLEQAREDLEDTELLYSANRFKGANNRAYYSIFHRIKAVLSLEPIDFKKHKDVIGYFNKNYIHPEIFPRQIGRKIIKASKIREDIDYVDEFIVNPEDTKSQIETARELLNLVIKYSEKNK